MTEPTEPIELADQTILQVLAGDHSSIFGLLDQLDAQESVDLMAEAPPADESLREQLVIQTVRHLVAEEQYLLPLVRSQLDHGDTLADATFAANRAIEDSLKGLENPHADAEFLSVVLATVRRQLTEHVTDQQDQLFQHLAQVVEPAELVRLADEAVGAEQVAPTRPRAIAPENPALNKMSSLVEGFIDHVRDSYSHRGAAVD